MCCLPGSAKGQEPPQFPAQRLGQVIWDVRTCELSWTVEEGTTDIAGTGFKAELSRTFVIDMDKATMKLGEEVRSFAPEEAGVMHEVLNLVAKYTTDSTKWWDSGRGKREKEKKEEKGKVD